ncbi:hypothetical protein PM076_03865 [Halorubrum ezzemoulense]|jgi:hypothetical protein|uniref:Uncharacterized protein n=1 Tax=Halorubrum ezzemoulense TaxID=337243 RepID=A0ABT4Z1B8_HALEZ|nr:MULTISPECIES: hypothetical protein [Halorubrum]MDB2225133.1 hypothetical protein [Halorubrum ezzemoulense]MDB2236868.1 hypothetical protein [Halorubrum ezzemoulense]MDB2242029.1 hypothetical protein [Halorubrum ezzemoulense]MDB2244433.1 hypothetical protein [Halorubrum ezzemoulense]MDB2247143.1 hypothetical protein [Halorubrum ezzemoulense]
MTDGAVSEEESGTEADGSEDDGDGRAEESAHVEDVPDGAGCTEIWERLSERREE